MTLRHASSASSAGLSKWLRSKPMKPARSHLVAPAMTVMSLLAGGGGAAVRTPSLLVVLIDKLAAGVALAASRYSVIGRRRSRPVRPAVEPGLP